MCHSRLEDPMGTLFVPHEDCRLSRHAHGPLVKSKWLNETGRDCVLGGLDGEETTRKPRHGLNN